MNHSESIPGISALQWAKEISKLPDGCFTISFYQYSRQHGTCSVKLKTLTGCKYREQLPQDRFDIDGDNYFLFTDSNGDPKMCYRILIRFMAFPNDRYKLHKVQWL